MTKQIQSWYDIATDEEKEHLKALNENAKKAVRWIEEQIKKKQEQEKKNE